MEATFTMWPLFRSSIGGNSARARRMGASRFVRTSSSARSGLISANGPAHPSPALLTRTSTRPATEMDSAAARSTSAGSARSAMITVPLVFAATSSSAARSRPSASTRAPPRASRSAVALPMPLDSGSRTVVFFPEGAFGPTNNCVGIGEVLKRRGHRVVFVVEESFAGTLDAKGFEERLMRLKPKPERAEEPGQFWKDFIRETAPQFRRPTIEQLEGLIRPIWRELIDGSRYVEPRLREIFDEVGPDVIVQDNVVAFPAVVTAGVPWVRIMSCNPLEMRDPDLPPTFSGYPATDRTGWEEFAKEHQRTHGDLWADFDRFCVESGAPHLGFLDFIHESPFLNLTLYPAEADYQRSRPLGPTWHRLDSCVRSADVGFELPDELSDREGALVYLSLGSLGSADVGLM